MEWSKGAIHSNESQMKANSTDFRFKHRILILDRIRIMNLFEYLGVNNFLESSHVF